MMIITGENRNSRRYTSPSAILPTTDLTLISQESNMGFCGEKSATSRLNLEDYNESKLHLKNHSYFTTNNYYPL